MAQEGVLHVESRGRAGARAATVNPGGLRERLRLQVEFKWGHQQGKSFWAKGTQIHRPLRCSRARGTWVSSRFPTLSLALWARVPVTARVSLRQEGSELQDCYLAPLIPRLRPNRCTDRHGRRFNGVQFLQAGQGRTSCPGPCTRHKGPTSNGTQGLQGEPNTPASLRGPVDRMCTCVTGAPGSQSRKPASHLGFLNSSLEMGDDQTVSAMFETSA